MTEKTAEWKCPGCGRVFARRDQSHYCEKPRSADAYVCRMTEISPLI